MLRHRILVVDDDPEMRLALQIRLRANNYEVCTAADGVSAIAETRRVMPDLVLLDLGLPAGDGFTVLERLKSSRVFEAIPVVVISGRDRVVNRERAERAGARLFLQKPIRHLELLQAIESILTGASDDDQVVYEIGRGAEQDRAR